LIELAEKLDFYFVDGDQFTLDAEASVKALQGRHVDPLTAYTNFLETVDESAYTPEHLETISKDWGKEYRPIFKAATGKKFKINQIFFPMRIALCGVGGGPGLFDVMQILGKYTTISRLRSGVEVCRNNG
jgi:glutamyl/glutaminyl-tRNA synthetase